MLSRKITAIITAVFTLVVMCGAPAVAFAADGDIIKKEETVYVVTGSDGVANDVIVSEHLINKHKVDKIKDKTDLSDIENVKGDETFNQKGDNITWNANGNDIYYQGRTTNEVPITMDVNYYLDGKKISGKALQGKSGNVAIKIRYSNNAQYEGQTVPMVVMAGMIITDDSFTDITINNGKIVDTGDKKVVAGIAAPGLADSMGISESDLGLSSTLEIRGKANKFAVKDIMTLATNDLFDGIDTSKIDELDYDDQIKQLDSGAKKLVNGSETLYDGLDSLNSKTPALKQGVSKLSDGSKKLLAGITQGLNGILDTLGKLGTVNTSLNNALSTLKSLNGNVVTDSTYIKDYSAMLMLASKSNDLTEGQAKQIINNVKNSGLSETDKIKIEKALGTQLTVNSVSSDLSTKSSAILSNSKTEYAAINGYDDESGGHHSGLIEAAAGETQYINGLKNAVNQQLDKTSGSTMSGGAAQLAAGLSQLDESASSLQSGVQQLSDGSESLNKGMKKLYKDGIKKIVDLYNDELKGLTSKLSSMVKAGKGYKTFTILPSNMDGNVKFIMKTTINK